jgi:hypothetical protein
VKSKTNKKYSSHAEPTDCTFKLSAYSTLNFNKIFKKYYKIIYPKLVSFTLQLAYLYTAMLCCYVGSTTTEIEILSIPYNVIYINLI